MKLKKMSPSIWVVSKTDVRSKMRTQNEKYLQAGLEWLERGE